MASKKLTILALLFSVLSSGVYAQLAGTIDYMDSSKYTAKNMAQYNEWANGLASSPFPPKPRDSWQLALYGGFLGILGDVTAPGYHIGISGRKALGYVVSVRPSISYGQIKGMGYANNASIANLPTVAQNPYWTTGKSTYVHAYKSDIILPSLDFLVSLNNIMFHKKQSNVNYYLLVGYSPVVYSTNIEALTSSGAAHTYSGVDFGGKRGDIEDQLNSYFDGNGGLDYETKAHRKPRGNNFNEPDGDYEYRHSLNMGGGLEARLGDIVSLSAEFKLTNTFEDWIDGYGVTQTAPTASKDLLLAGNIGLNFNLGLKSRKKYQEQAGKDGSKQDLGQFPGKRVAPLWMHNPLGQPYGELANPTRMNIPPGWLQDSDNDGVPDQFDLEPNTPSGAPVDSRGRARDTDNDGVPDHLDKELITPTYCQPVDADGVGKCPDPACCTDRPPVPVTPACNIGSLPSVQFASGKAALSSSANSILDAAASQIMANPDCKICVVGHGGSSKREQQLSWDRVNSVINYLSETKGISRDRFVFKYGEAGDANTVDLQDCTGESGPNNVPPPHPQYRATK